MPMIIKKTANNTMYIVQELQEELFHNHLKAPYKSVNFHQYFHYIRQLIY